MLRFLRWFRAIGRSERRSITRYPARQLLLCLLIAIPIAALVAGANFLFITDPTTEERATSEMGMADLRADVGGLMTALELKRQLPTGATFELIRSDITEVRIPGRSMNVRSWRMNVDGIAKGMLALTAGSAPQVDSEVAVSKSLLTSLHLQVGDTIAVLGDECTIVGEVENPEAHEMPLILRPALNAGFVDTALICFGEGVDSSDIRMELARLTRRGDVALDFEDIDGFMMIAMFGFAEAALIIAAAFIVGLRRRQREIGLLSSCGGTPLQVLTSVVVSAFFISLVAASIGTVLGLLSVRTAYPWFDAFKGRRCGPFEICWSRHSFAVALGVLTGLLSAILPAIAAARLPTRVALSGRSPAPRSSGRFMACGFVLVAVGVALVWYAPNMVQEEVPTEGDGPAILTILLGSILGIIGLGLWSPWLLGRCAQLASRLPLSARLAVREVGRFRTRNGPIVTAILAGMSLSVMMATFYQGVRGIQERFGQHMRDDQLVVSGPDAKEVASQIHDTLQGSSVSPIKLAALNNELLLVRLEGDRPVQIAIGSGALLRALGVPDSEMDAATQQLQSGGLLSLSRIDSDSPIPITTVNASQEAAPIAELQAFDLETSADVSLGIGFVVAQKTADELGWSKSMERSEFVRPGDWILRSQQPVSPETFERASKVAAVMPLTSVDAQLNHELDTTYYWGILCIAFAISLGIVAVATMLASSEAKADQQILAVVGASPITYRNQAAARAGFLTLLGCCLAIPAGLLPAAGLVSILPIMELSIPWTQLTTGVCILPTAAAAMTWFACRVSTPPRSFQSA
ncbi:MAG: ABC transporter permease [Planctomycetota bacterium]